MAVGDVIASTVTISGHDQASVDAYYARPPGVGPFPGVVIVHHIFGVDEWIMEVCRRMAHHGYAAVAPNLFSRMGDIGGGPVEDLAARIRSRGGLNDDVVVGDLHGSQAFLKAQPESSGITGIIGFCLGGRLAYLAGGRVEGFSAVVDCWGGGVAPNPNAPNPMPNATPPVEYTASITAPVLGLFGNDDTRPDIAEVNRTEDALKAAGKTYEFYRYDGAGHAFLSWNSVAHRPQQAQDAWEKIWAFFGAYLQTPAGTT